MKIIITGKGLEISDSLRARAEKRIGKLSRYFEENTEIQVRMVLERGGRNIVEITVLPYGGDILRGEVITDDMYKSVDRALEKIEAQIHRHRTKLEKRLKADAFVPTAPEFMEAPESEEESPQLLRVKRFPVKPIEVEDAIHQMDMLGHSFFAFQNAQTGGICVVYRRNDGGYGLLEPEPA